MEVSDEEKCVGKNINFDNCIRRRVNRKAATDHTCWEILP
jgi:hypothetical protein